MWGRLLIAGIFIPLLIFVMLLGEVTFFVFVTIVIGVSLYEFYTMIEKSGFNVYKKSGIILGLLFPLFNYLLIMGKLKESQDYGYLALSLVIIMFITRRILKGDIETAIRDISYTIFGVLYIGFMFTHFFLLRFIDMNTIELFGLEVSFGRLWTFSALLLIWSSDSAAYFIGITFGKHKLLPRVSPKKSVEGAIAAVVAPILSMIILKMWLFKDLEWYHAVIIGIIVGVFGQVGDLGESLFKRQLNIKDSGNILMGHGGMLDRFDSLLFVAPMMYYYLKIFVI